MRYAIPLILLLAALPAVGQNKSATAFRIEFEPGRDVTMLDRHQGQEGLFLAVRFTISLDADQKPDDANYKVIIKEDGRRVHAEDIFRPSPSEDLSVVLAIDTSGSMAQFKRMDQAKAAANVFLSKLPSTADCGLLLFDHEMRPPEIPPIKDRRPLQKAIAAMTPRGGTAYLDASVKGIDMLRPFPKREKAIVLLTDGIDLGSIAALEAVINQARRERVRIYTVGIGEPGKLEPVNTVLVLDHSGSMKPPADEGDSVSKIEALHKAASRYVKIMPSTGRASLIPFNSVPARPTDFSNDKQGLVQMILSLQPDGETSFFDATYAAIGTLDAQGAKGKRAVIAMTDGVDNTSRRRVEEVIERAREAKIPLYLLGFGKPGELDAGTMDRMAKSTGGQYYHASNEKALVQIFENLSIQLHDDGIDEFTLKKLAYETGGQYYPAKNVTDLQIVLEGVTRSIQKKTYEIVFKSPRQVRDGTQRAISLELARSNGELVSNTASGTTPKEEIIAVREGGYQTSGVVIAEMDSRVYLGLLLLLGVLISLPALLKRTQSA